MNVVLGLLLAGQVSMPLVCFLSAYKLHFRYLFPVPVVSLIAAALGLLYFAL